MGDFIAFCLCCRCDCGACPLGRGTCLAGGSADRVYGCLRNRCRRDLGHNHQPLYVSLAIVFATAATLHANGVRDIETSAQAAEALRPIAGNFAFALFSLGIIGTGLLAVPVLAGSAAYAVTEMFGIASSLDAKPTKARLFYGTIAVTTMLGVSLQYVGIDPARALYWAAVVNGVLAAPLMVMMMLIVRNPRAMGRFTLGSRATITGWFTTLVMAGATIIFFATL